MNKDIQLCGLGNALVDIQFEVSDKEIAALNLEKGTMSLVDTPKQYDIINFLGNRTHNKCSGGSAANTIIAFSSFGGKAAYKTALGNDQYGNFYLNEFANLGIIMESKMFPEIPTGLCFVLISPDSERTMATSLGANSFQTKEHIDDDLIKRSEWLYIEGYKIADTNGQEMITHAINVAKKYDTKIAVTFSDKFIVEFFKSQLDEILESTDLIFCNELEAITYTNCENLHDAFKSLSSKNYNVAMTMGSKGSYIKWEDVSFEIPAYKAKPIDSTGAGDMYSGGFLYGITHGKSPMRAGHLGSLAASKIVSQLGARLNESHTMLRNKVFSEII